MYPFTSNCNSCWQRDFCVKADRQNALLRDLQESQRQMLMIQQDFLRRRYEADLYYYIQLYQNYSQTMLSQARFVYNEPTLSVEKLFFKFAKDVAVEAIIRQMPDGNFKRFLQGASLANTLFDLITGDQKEYDALSAALKIGAIIYEQLVRIQSNRC